MLALFIFSSWEIFILGLVSARFMVYLKAMRNVKDFQKFYKVRLSQSSYIGVTFRVFITQFFLSSYNIRQIFRNSVTFG